MSSVAATSNIVLKNFLDGANAQYRSAGLGQYQMRLQKDGTVTVPGRPAPEFGAPRGTGSAAADQATAGAAPAPAGPAAPAGPVKRAGPAPTISVLEQSAADAFTMGWKPIQGAKQYGVWQDGKLIGHVANPTFAGNLAAGASGTIQVDAVRPDGTRTALTRVLRVARTPDGKITFDVPGATGPAEGAPPTAPAAPAG